MLVSQAIGGNNQKEHMRLFIDPSVFPLVSVWRAVHCKWVQAAAKEKEASYQYQSLCSLVPSTIRSVADQQ